MADVLNLNNVSAPVASNDAATKGYVDSGSQPLNSNLTAIAGLASAANKLAYFTGSGTAALASFTPAGHALALSADATIGGTNTGDQFTGETASTLIGRGSAGGSGAAQEIALGTGLSMSGTTLSASGGVVNSICNGRLTLSTGVPVPTTDVTGATNIYFTPYAGNTVALWNGSAWIYDTFTQITQALGTLVNAQAYDLFAYDVSGTVTLEMDEWANATVTMTIATPGVVTWTAHGMSTGQSITFTNSGGALPTGVTANTAYFITVVDANTFKLSTTQANLEAGTFVATSGSQSGTHTGHQPQARQTAVTLQDGVYCKSGDKTRRYLGTFVTTATTTTEDSAAKRFVWNYYNRTRRQMVGPIETTDSWTYSTASYRQANANAANQLACVIGVSEDVVEASVTALFAGSGTGIAVASGVGIDRISVNSAQTHGQTPQAAGTALQGKAFYNGMPSVGYHFLAWLEYGGSTTTFYGDAGLPAAYQSGIQGSLVN